MSKEQFTSFAGGFGGYVIPQQSVYDEIAETVANLPVTPRRHSVGDRIAFRDGRCFIYTKNGTSASLPIATVCQSAAESTNYTNLAVAAAAAIGAKSVTVTLGGTAVTANQLAGGFLHVDASTGGGQGFRIKDHLAQATTTGNVVINLYDAIQTALTTSSKVTLTAHIANGVITAPVSTPTGTIVGIASKTITAGTAAINYYGWLQTWGLCVVRCVGTLVVGDRAECYTGTTAGCVGPAAGDLLPLAGRVVKVNATSTYSLIDLTISR